jgi:hypothetical protein
MPACLSKKVAAALENVARPGSPIELTNAERAAFEKI